MENMKRRLDDLRSELTLRLLSILTTGINDRGQKDRVLRQEITDVVAVNYQDLQSTLSTRYAETIEAILTTKLDEVFVISGNRNGSELMETLSNENFAKTTVTYSNDEHSSPTVLAREFSGYHRLILDALHFRSIADRQSAINPAHRKTFEWVWNGSKSEDKKWHPLWQWLESREPTGGNCYWISGKAGSGKSSLMKYIFNDSRLSKCLQKWSCDTDLITASYYFWYAGTELQKSQAGLVRTLLLAVLTCQPELISVAFPEICRSSISGQLHGQIRFSDLELKIAFQKVFANLSSKTKVCMLVDGIDEYTGDCNVICDQLLEVAGNKNVKIIISSRPIPACVDRLANCPTLRLQDLTRKDIENYVRTKLGNNTLMMRLDDHQPGTTERIITTITNRASGVFLWIVLVVQNIGRSLQNYDTVPGLMREIEKLPSDLAQLYEHMLHSTDQKYRREGARLLQLVLRSLEVSTAYSMTLLQLSFAEDEGCLLISRRRLTAGDIDWRCEAVEGRLRSRCCGLVEVQEPSKAGDGTSRAHLTVTFLHRTVVEYLQHGPVWRSISQLSGADNQNVDFRLLHASVLELYALPIQPFGSKDAMIPYDRLFRALIHGNFLEGDVFSKFQTSFLPLLRNALGFHRHNKEVFESALVELRHVKESERQARQNLVSGYPLLMAVSIGLQSTEDDTFTMLNDAMFIATPMEAHLPAYFLSHFVQETHAGIRSIMAENLSRVLRSSPSSLDNASDVSKEAKYFWRNRWSNKALGEDISNLSIWELMLHHCFSMTNDCAGGVYSTKITTSAKAVPDIPLLDVLITMLQAGAPACTTVSLDHRIGMKRKVSSLYILRKMLLTLWRIAVEQSETFINNVADRACNLEDDLVGSGAIEVNEIYNPHGENAVKHYAAPLPPLRDPSLRQRIKDYNARHKVRKIEPPMDPNRSNDNKRASVSPTPWQVYKTCQQQQNEQTQLPSPPGTVSERTWSMTPKNRRVELLSYEERQIVQKMQSPNQTAKERRTVLGLLAKLPYERQSRVMECAKIETSSQAG